MADNDDIKAQMALALQRKQQGHDGVAEGGSRQEKSKAARGRQGGATMFRRKSGGGS